MDQGMSFCILLPSRPASQDVLPELSVNCLSFLLRCLAHFPPADTYESRGDAADVSRGLFAVCFDFELHRACVKTDRDRMEST